jgi:16S rRNA (cytosine1402-N4)-methyltransferase
LDEAERGFSFRFDAPLDMRMDTTRGQTAAQWLAVVGETDLKEVISQYGEERYARSIARAIVAQRAVEAITTTKQLTQLIASVIPRHEPGQNPATRTFQAIRIYINRELEELSIALPACAGLLKSAGRLVVISFHSLEDRIVKRFMRELSSSPELPARLPIKAVDIPAAKMKLIGRAIKPSEGEVTRNPRARSAVMRVMEVL